MSEHHSLAASPATVHWGYFDAKLAPRLTVDSGDTVTLHCVSGGPGEVGARPDLLPEHRAILDEIKPYLGPHILTGPVAVRGAQRGDTLEVRIRDVQLRADWSYNGIKPLRGTLPEDFPMLRILQIPLDRKRMTATLPWGPTRDASRAWSPRAGWCLSQAASLPASSCTRWRRRSCGRFSSVSRCPIR